MGCMARPGGKANASHASRPISLIVRNSACKDRFAAIRHHPPRHYAISKTPSTSTAAFKRQGRSAHCGPRMTAGVAKDGNHEIGGAVNDFWLIDKVRRAINEAAEFYNAP